MDILYGVVSPSGKLPVSVAVNAGQIPIYYNHPWGSASHQGESIGFANYLETSHKPRYCFGYGLSYGEFVYSDMKISKPEVKPDELITVSCQVMMSQMQMPQRLCSAISVIGLRLGQGR